jgi:hypothetical protein
VKITPISIIIVAVIVASVIVSVQLGQTWEETAKTVPIQTSLEDQTDKNTLEKTKTMPPSTTMDNQSAETTSNKVSQPLYTQTLSENQTEYQLPIEGRTSESFSENLTFNVKNLIVTRDFGQKLMLEMEVSNFTGAYALDALKSVADVETLYGGGFVNSINGVSSKYVGIDRSKEDWFFYVNGIMANIGSGVYVLNEGDVQHWDYHNWKYYPPTATIGFFPEPFSHGYSGEVFKTVVLYDGELEEEAKLIQEFLIKFDVKDVSTLSVNELTDEVKGTSNLIILGTSDSKMVSELNELREKLGFYVYFEEGQMIILNMDGSVAKNCASGGVIQATQSPWNPKGNRACENVVWMIAGVEEGDVKSIVKLVTEKYEDMQYAFAVAIVEEKVCRVPLC